VANPPTHAKVMIRAKAPSRMVPNARFRDRVMDPPITMLGQNLRFPPFRYRLRQVGSGHRRPFFSTNICGRHVADLLRLVFRVRPTADID